MIFSCGSYLNELISKRCRHVSQMSSAPLTAQEVGVTAAFCLMVTAALIGNSLVCLVVLPNKNMRTPMNYLLCNLAMADMTVAVFVSPQFIFSRAFVHPEGTTGTWLCRLVTGKC